MACRAVGPAVALARVAASGQEERLCAEIELLDLYWTSAGPVDVHVGREWSTFDWRDRCANAARVGFRGLGLWHADIEHQLESRSLREMRSIFDDAGLALPPSRVPGRFLRRARDRPSGPSPTARRRLLFETAAAFGAHHIKVGNIPGTPCELERLTEEFAALCDDAAQQHRRDGRATSSCRSTSTSTRSRTRSSWCTGAGRANGGLAIDTWHMAKLGIAPEELQPDPARLSQSGSSCPTASSQNMEDRVDETVNHRRLPGRGRVRPPRLRRGVPRRPATTSRGGSRCCRPRCASFRSSSSSSAPMRRPWLSSHD